jgi:hypothetical protein
MMIKMLLTIAALVMLALPLRADGPSLVLAVHQTTIKPDSKVIFDVYICNTSSAPVKVPALQLITTSFWTRNMKDIASPTAGSVENEGEMRFNPPGDHLLPANTVETRRIERKISARPGDVVEVSVTVGQKKQLRSNSVLLFCLTK